MTHLHVRGHVTHHKTRSYRLYGYLPGLGSGAKSRAKARVGPPAGTGHADGHFPHPGGFALDSRGELSAGATKIDFEGTPLMPDGKGGATVESERGVIRVSAGFENFVQPSTFGPEYLTPRQRATA